MRPHHDLMESSLLPPPGSPIQGFHLPSISCTNTGTQPPLPYLLSYHQIRHTLASKSTSRTTPLGLSLSLRLYHNTHFYHISLYALTMHYPPISFYLLSYFISYFSPPLPRMYSLGRPRSKPVCRRLFLTGRWEFV